MKLYPGAMTVMVPRICTYIFSMIICYILVRIIYLGTTFGDTQPGWRKSISEKLITFFSGLMLVVGLGIIPYVKHKEEADYSYWLGPEFKHAKFDNRKQPSAIVSNHMSFVDIIMMLFVSRT